jgi:hypothetical protein
MRDMLIQRAKDLGNQVAETSVSETKRQIKSTFFLTKMTLYVGIGFLSLMSILACVGIYKLFS